MSTDLAKRADAMRAKYKTLESVTGSGYHDNDRNPSRPDLFMAPQSRGLPRCSDSVVAFTDYDEEEVWFAGEDATKVMGALQGWMSDHKSDDISSMPGTNRKLMLKIIPKLAVTDGPRLRVWLCDWNDVIAALNEKGVGILGAPLVHDGTTA